MVPMNHIKSLKSLQGTYSTERVETDFHHSPPGHSFHRSQTSHSPLQEASGQSVSPELLMTLNYQWHAPQFISTLACTREACCLRIVLTPVYALGVRKPHNLCIHKWCWLHVVLTQND